MNEKNLAPAALNWDDLKIFLAVASEGSVRAAAPLLGVNQSTVSRRIHSLEKELDIHLFEKLPSGYSITEVGTAVLNHAQRIENEFHELNQQIFSRNSDLEGSVRLTVCSPFLSNLLMQDLADFSDRYPGIKIEILSSEHELNLSKREADIAIRVTSSPPEHLVGRRISGYSQSIYASLTYIQQTTASFSDNHKEQSGLRWLANITPLELSNYTEYAPYKQAVCHHHIDQVALQYEAAKAGMGMALLPCFIGDRDPVLMKMPSTRSFRSSAVWVLMHPDSRRTARVGKLYSFISEKLLQYGNFFEGDV